MLTHPHCPCSRASIGELARLMAQAQGRVTAYVLFIKPAGSPEDWENSDLWQIDPETGTVRGQVKGVTQPWALLWAKPTS